MPWEPIKSPQSCKLGLKSTEEIQINEGCQTTPPPQKKNSNAWKQDDELLNCKHVLLFIKRKDDSEGETKYPEDRTKSHQELFSLYKQSKKVSSASWIRKLLCTSDSFSPSISFLNQNMYSYNPRLSHYVCGEC